MKLRPLAEAIGITLIMSQTVHAAPNGKLFQELNALIEENANAIDENGELIEQNSAAILSFNTELSFLDDRLGVLQTSFNGLNTSYLTLQNSVNKTTDDINLAFAQLASIEDERSDEAAIAALREELLTMIAANQAGILINEAELQAMNDDLIKLALDKSAIAQDLQAQIQVLAPIVVSNFTSIAPLTTQVTLLSSTLSALNAQYNNYLTQNTLLARHVGTHHGELELLTFQLIHLSNRATDADNKIESEHPTVSLTLTDTDAD